MVNTVTLIGNVGQNPEAKELPSGSMVVNLSVATNRSWKDKDGEQQKKTTWHKVVAFNGTAKFIAGYVKKGDQLYVTGRIQNRTYEDKDGKTMYVSEIMAYRVQKLGKVENVSEGGAPVDIGPVTGDVGEEDIPF